VCCSRRTMFICCRELAGSAEPRGGGGKRWLTRESLVLVSAPSGRCILKGCQPCGNPAGARLAIASPCCQRTASAAGAPGRHAHAALGRSAPGCNSRAEKALPPNPLECFKDLPCGLNQQELGTGIL
jgi:hypothetical protein